MPCETFGPALLIANEETATDLFSILFDETFLL